MLLKDRYRAQGLLGQGGFGKTFKAVDEDRPRKPLCVIKQFTYSNADAQTQQVALQLFYEEARHLEALGSHPQVPELLAYFDVDGQSYLVQEFIDGGDLQQKLDGNGAFDQHQVQQLLASLLPVLAFLHSRSVPVIHRDLKPANIIQRYSDNQLVLVDFGAAKQATQSILAKTGTQIGSPEFSAPEQIRGKPTFASDIFSLGVTCIYLLTKVSPFDLFDVNSDVWVWRDYLQDNPVDRHLGEVLDQMIANSLPQRYQSAVEVLQALNIKQESPSAANSLPDQSQSIDLQNAEDNSNPATSKPNQNSSRALTDLNKVIELAPENTLAYNNRGLLKHYKLNDISGALADYNKVIDLAPENTLAYNNRGLLKHYKLNDISGALADYSRAIDLAPENALAYTNRGLLKHYKLNDISGALADYNKAVELEPKNAWAYYCRGALRADKIKDSTGAIQDFQRAESLYRQHDGTSKYMEYSITYLKQLGVTDSFASASSQ